MVADRLIALRAEHGPDSVGVFGGGGLTNEKAYLLGKFARVALGTSQVDYNGRFCMSSAAAAGIRAFGVDRGLPFPVTDLDNADVVLLAGANVAETMPPFVGHLTGADLIVVDPRRSATAELAALHLQPAPGHGSGAGAGSAARRGRRWPPGGATTCATAPPASTTPGGSWRAGGRNGWSGSPGCRSPTSARACAMLAEANYAYLLTGRGTEQHANGTDTVSAWINLCLALGLPGTAGLRFRLPDRPGQRPGRTRTRAEGRPTSRLPQDRRSRRPRTRRTASGACQRKSLPGPGRSAYELLDALGTPGGPKALLVFGSNPVVSAPNAGHVTDRLSALDLLVVADFVLSETAARADVVLPVTQWAEEDGTMTSLEGRVLLRQRAVDPPERCAQRPGSVARPVDPARAAGRSVSGRTCRGVRRTASRVGGGNRGLRGNQLRAAAFRRGPALAGACRQAPWHATDVPGPVRPSGRPGALRAASTSPGTPSPLTTSSRCTPPPAGSCSTTSPARRPAACPELVAAVPEVFVEIHPDTAARAGLADGWFRWS